MHVPSSRIIPPSIKSPVNIFFLPSFNIFFIVALIYTFHKYCIRLSYMCLSYCFGISVVAIASPQITVSITSTTISPMIFSLSFHLFSLVSFCYLIAQSESHNQITAPISRDNLLSFSHQMSPASICSLFRSFEARMEYQAQSFKTRYSLSSKLIEPRICSPVIKLIPSMFDNSILFEDRFR